MKEMNYKFSVSRIIHLPSGRSVEILSNQPTVHFYTGRYLPQAQWQKDRTIPQSTPDVEGDSDYDEVLELIPKKVYFKRKLMHQESEPAVESDENVNSDDSKATITVSASETAAPLIEDLLSKTFTSRDKATSTVPYPIKVSKTTSTSLSYRDKATSTTPLVITLEKDGDGILAYKHIPPDPDKLAEWEKRILEVIWCVYDQLDRLHPCICDFTSTGISRKPVFGIRGAQYHRYGGICIASQGYPDAVNQVSTITLFNFFPLGLLNNWYITKLKFNSHN